MILRTGQDFVDAIVSRKIIERGEGMANWQPFDTYSEATIFVIDNPIGRQFDYRSVARPDVPVYKEIL